MKKFLLSVSLFTVALSSFAGGGCVIDTSNTAFFSPMPDSIPCIERGVAYSQVIQIHVPENFDIAPFVGLPFPILLTVDSMQIDSITGFPNGFTYNLNPADGHFLGGDNGCAFAYGTTNDPAGNYPLTIHGTISVSGIPQGFGFPSDTSFQLEQAQSMSNMFNLSVDVIELGDDCRPQANGINNLNSELNTLLSVYPNPSSGIINVALNSSRRIAGEVCIVNIAGQKVATVSMDVMGKFDTTFNLSTLPKGLYTVLLKTTEGIAAKNVSVE
jgi:hypothetical protein